MRVRDEDRSRRDGRARGRAQTRTARAVGATGRDAAAAPRDAGAGGDAAAEPSSADADSRRRLLDVAGETFAELGFRNATVREICRRAAMNVSSVNYHFRSKEELYLAALREALDRTRHAFAPRPDPPLDRADLPRFLRFFVKNAIERILTLRPEWQPKLLQRELAEPTFALDTVIKETMRPHFKYLRDCMAPFLPKASEREIDLHALSVIGQIVYYRCAGPIAFRLLGVKQADARFLDQLAEHIAAFSARALGVCS